MGMSKKMYKYTAIISMTIVLMLIFNLFKPMITIADSTYGISSINYNKDEEIMTVTCNKLDYHVNSFLYWVSTEEDIPTKDDLDVLANWCINNAIKVVPLNTNSISDSIQIKKTGKYYAVMLLKKADEEGTEEYVKAFIARYVVNTPIKKDDLENQVNKESLIVDSKDQEPEKKEEEQLVQEPEKKEEEQPAQEPEKKEEEQPAQEPEKKEEEQPVQEPEKKEEEQPAQEPEKKEEEQPAQEPEKKEEEQPAQEPKKEEQQTVKENENKSNDDKPVYVNVNCSNNNIIEDEYIDVVEEEPKNVDNTKSNSNNEENKKDKLSNYINESIQKAQNEKNKKTEEMRANVERMNKELNENKENVSNKENKEETKKSSVQEVNSNNINDANVEKRKNVDKEVKTEKIDVLANVQVDDQAKGPIPQTGNNDAGLVLGIVVFSIIGVASFVKYRKIK